MILQKRRTADVSLNAAIPKTNILNPKNEGLAYESPFHRRDFQVPC